MTHADHLEKAASLLNEAWLRKKARIAEITVEMNRLKRDNERIRNVREVIAEICGIDDLTYQPDPLGR